METAKIAIFQVADFQLGRHGSKRRTRKCQTPHAGMAIAARGD